MALLKDVSINVLFVLTFSQNNFVSAATNENMYANRDLILDIKKIKELETLVIFQNKRISALEKHFTDLNPEWVSKTDLTTIVRKQNDQIDQLKGRIHELEILLEVHENVRTNLSKSDENYINPDISSIKEAFTSPEQRKFPRKRVAFFAYLSSRTPDLTAYKTLTFDTVITNVGNAYNPKSGVFIAPQSGLYVFTWTIRINRNNYHPTELVVDNKIISSIFLDPRNTVDSSVSSTSVVNVKKSSKVLIRTSSADNNGYIFSDDYGRSSFAGWKLM